MIRGGHVLVGGAWGFHLKVQAPAGEREAVNKSNRRRLSLVGKGRRPSPAIKSARTLGAFIIGRASDAEKMTFRKRKAPEKNNIWRDVYARSRNVAG